MDLIGFRFKNFQRGRCTDAGIGITLAEQVNMRGTGTEITADHDGRIHIEYGKNGRIAMIERLPFHIFRLAVHHERQSGKTAFRRAVFRISARGKIYRTGDSVGLGSDVEFSRSPDAVIPCCCSAIRFV